MDAHLAAAELCARHGRAARAAELRRLAERHRGTPEAAHAARAIARLRAELFADAG